MFIQFQETPNPNTLKFLPGCPVLDKATATRDYKDAASAVHSPLAKSLFGLEGVSGVFLGPDFVSVTQDGGQDWDMLKTRIMAVLLEHLSSGLPVVNYEAEEKDAARTGKGGMDDLEDEISRQIKELLDTRVKPAVAMDGGNIEFVSFDDGIVYVRMEGACAGCPSSTATLKMGIENMLKHYIPEVERVEPESF